MGYRIPYYFGEAGKRRLTPDKGRAMNNKALKINVFCCVTSYDQAEIMRHFSPPGCEMQVISLPCSGKLDILYLVKAFETGADGVAVMMCPEGECRYLEGNLRAKKRAAAVEELLKETGLGEGRVAVIQLDGRGIEHTMQELEQFCLKIAALPQGNRARALQA
jgi:F420-non-reducing hydrogenase iron-sulfur subunit